MTNEAYGPKSTLTRDASGAPVVFNRIKRITSHVGLSRYIDTLFATGHVIKSIAEIPSPYFSSPTRSVYREEGAAFDSNRYVFVVETAHKRYDVFAIPTGVKFFLELADGTLAPWYSAGVL